MAGNVMTRLQCIDRELFTWSRWRCGEIGLSHAYYQDTFDYTREVLGDDR